MANTFSRRQPIWLVLAAFVLVLLGAGQADAAPSYQHFINAYTREALALQGGKVVLLPADKTRFAQQWEIFDVRSDGTFMLRNRGGLDACLARDGAAAPSFLEAAVVRGCAGTNDTSKRWRSSIAGGIEGPEFHEFIRNANSQQFLAPFTFCLTNPCPPADGALYSPQFRVDMLNAGTPGTYFSWSVRTV